MKVERLVSELRKAEPEISYIWIKEVGDAREGKHGRPANVVLDTGDGKHRPIRVKRVSGVTGGVWDVQGVRVYVGTEQHVLDGVRRNWGYNKRRKGSELQKLRNRYQGADRKKQRLVRVLETAREYQQAGILKTVYRKGDEIVVMEGTGTYVFGVNYGVMRKGVNERELFEFVPHKESMRTAKEKCKQLGIGNWVHGIIDAYDLRRG